MVTGIEQVLPGAVSGQRSRFFCMPEDPENEEYEAAFERVVARRWWDLTDQQRMRTRGGWGQVSPTSPPEFAIADTFHNQSRHKDAFCRALAAAGPGPPGPGQSVTVVDIGAGACTVAVALGMSWGAAALRSVDYFAVETHPTMRELGTALMDALGWPFRSIAVLDAIDGVPRVSSGLLLLTFSYVLQQRSVAPRDLDDWARFAAGDTCPERTEAVIASANVKARGGIDHTDSLRERLSHMGMPIVREHWELQHPPRDYRGWPNLRIEHWTLQRDE